MSSNKPSRQWFGRSELVVIDGREMAKTDVAAAVREQFVG